MLEYIKQLIDAPMTNPDLKEKAKNFLANYGRRGQEEAAKELIPALKENISTVDDVIALCESDVGKKVFGEEGAKVKADYMKARKARHHKYCDCDACKAARKLYEAKDTLFQ